MASVDREHAVSRAFVEMADTLVREFDVAELMQRLVDYCTELLAIDAAGLLLRDQRGGLQLMATTSEATRMLELFQVQVDEGPCLQTIQTGVPVFVADMEQVGDRWPRFAPAALRTNFRAVHALPLRLRDDVLGALNLFGRAAGTLPEADVELAQALADVACIGILQARAIAHSEMLVEQLEGALTSRLTIEQAKGMIADRGGLSMDQAFALLRARARNTNAHLSAVAAAVVEGRVKIEDLQRTRQPLDPK